MPEWLPPIAPAAARSKLPVQPIRSIHDSQCWRTASAFSRCFCLQMPPVTLISSAPSGRQTEADGCTGPPCLADDIKNLGSFTGEDRYAVKGDGDAEGGPAVVPGTGSGRDPAAACGQVDVTGAGPGRQDGGDEEIGAEQELVLDPPCLRVIGEVDE